MAKTVAGRKPLPKNCDQNWETTSCPRIAVVTSAAYDTAAGNDAYSNDTEAISYYSLFNLFGMVPKHISLHRDNYKIHGDPNTTEGMANLILISKADIIYFNGGDQSRHVRAWLNDDGSMTSLLKVIRERAMKN